MFCWFLYFLILEYWDFVLYCVERKLFKIWWMWFFIVFFELERDVWFIECKFFIIDVWIFFIEGLFVELLKEIDFWIWGWCFLMILLGCIFFELGCFEFIWWVLCLFVFFVFVEILFKYWDFMWFFIISCCKLWFSILIFFCRGFWLNGEVEFCGWFCDFLIDLIECFWCCRWEWVWNDFLGLELWSGDFYFDDD